MFLKILMFFCLLSSAQASSSQGIKESQELSDPDQKSECPCKLAPKRRSLGAVVGLGRAKRYTSSSPTAFASPSADFSKQCNSYGGRIICFRSYKSAIAAPPADFTCWSLVSGGLNCTETDNLGFLDNNDRYFSSPSSSQQYAQPRRRYSSQPEYSAPSAQQSGYGQPMDQPRYNPHRQQQGPSVPVPKDSDFGAASGRVSLDFRQPQSNVRVNQPDPYSSA